MRSIIDWHIHSKFSRSCSKSLELPQIGKWCERKGIDIVSTADWTHPEWFDHIKEYLIEDGSGLLKLKDSSSKTQFMLTTEVSQIYKKGDKCRRIHNLIFSPSLEACEKVNQEFDRRELNRRSDGRPILGIDSEELYKMLKDIDERIIVVPAHAWTPWYSVFGSKSGFDSLDECFGSMTPYIYAIETGLSSDPVMNWQISKLDRVVLISNSDAHSLNKLGREANVFDLENPTYDELVRILKEQDKKKFLYTIEFYPEEGKYHFDGCANCGFSCHPTESKKLDYRCPQCKKPMTLGVHHRVDALSDRDAETVRARKIPFKSIVPLEEILAECLGVNSTNSKKVAEEYLNLTDKVADEFSILLDVPIEEIARATDNPYIPEAIKKMREGDMAIKPGYDGVFGQVSIFGPEGPRKPKQNGLF
ncbi:endonuclease Q family protein [Patescibacteria group bacterium]|nr:endonuclease Q family protein [Patescibacteria group bacterium]MBU1705700.1 endonuclease Q family protein [Patescibacteria group bacterium]